MNRQEKLDKLKSQLHEKEIFEIRGELVGFLQEDPDAYTGELQKIISEKLDDALFHHCCFADFLNDYAKDNPTDPAGYSDFHSRIYGK